MLQSNMNFKMMLKKTKVLYPLWHLFRIKHNERKEEKKIKAYQKHGNDTLKKLMNLVIAYDYNCIAVSGTLVGLIRDGQLIPWDDDLDFAIIENEEFAWNEFENNMKKAGFKKYRQFEENDVITGQGYKWKNVLCDFSLWKMKPNEASSSILYNCVQVENKEYINNEYMDYRAVYKDVSCIKTIIVKEFNGIHVKIPQNYEEVLSSLYGDGWKIPDKNYKSNLKEVIISRKAIYY